MPRWPSRILARVHALAAEGKVVHTRKAAQELADLDLDLTATEVVHVLANLRVADTVQRLRSEHDNSWLYLFRPTVVGVRIYLKLAVRENCVVVSFHEYL